MENRNNYGFDIETWNEIKKIEFLRSSDWQIDFTEALEKIKESGCTAEVI